MKKFISLLAFLVALLCVTISANLRTENAEGEKVRNVIILIGDGMGLSQMSSAYYFQEGTPNFSRFPIVGLSRTSASSHKITDSAAGAT
ncbi:MAG: alkaline phosphatase, partial [Owenweeksia sp.]